MRIEHTRQMFIELNGAEIDTIAIIVRLAIKQLESEPAFQCKGSPLIRQAGLVGQDLHQLKDILSQLAFELGCGDTLERR